MSQTARTKITNFTRTWKVDLYGNWGDGPGASLFIASHIVTLTADENANLTAIIDGENQPGIDRAVGYLQWAKNCQVSRLEVVREGPTAPPIPPRPPAPVALSAPPIGKARACVLHKIMGITGLSKGQHYAISAAALGEPWPLDSLADLTEREAGTVWAHLCRLYPRAREVAAGLQSRHQTQTAA